MFNVGFRPVTFKPSQPKIKPLAGSIQAPELPKLPKLPTKPQPTAGLISPPKAPKPNKPTINPPIAGLISPPKTPKDPKNLPPLAGKIILPDKK